MGLINGTKRLITDSVNDLARNSAYKVMGKGNQAIHDSFIDMTSKEINKLGHITAGAVKYGVYGATGAGIIGGVTGAIQQDKTFVGGTVNGAGLGAVAGAGAGAVAAAIAKGLR